MEMIHFQPMRHIRIGGLIHEIMNKPKVIRTETRIRKKGNNYHIRCNGCKSKIAIGSSYCLVIYDKQFFNEVILKWVHSKTYCSDKCIVVSEL
jgi:hypothetical protein